MFTTNLKALFVVLVVATCVFIVAKPVCLRYMEAKDFARRRNVWFAVTIAAFTTTSFWLFLAVAMPLLFLSARKENNPVALYVFMMQVIPTTIHWDIPVVVINRLFDLDIYRILSFAVLVPAVLRLARSPGKPVSGVVRWIDVLVFGFVLLQVLLLMPYETFTNSMRRGFLLSLDYLLLYFVVSRTCTNRHAIADVMVSFCLACAIMAPLALFEALKHWLLYAGIAEEWGSALRHAYLFREGILRAQVTSGQALQFGYAMAMGFGLWLYLRSRVQSTPVRVIGPIWLWMGLLASYSRGPWLVAVGVYFAYLALVPRGAVSLFRALAVSILVGALVLVSPVGGRVINNLPFVGNVGEGNVEYRVRLADNAWQQVQQHPFFGSPFVMKNLEDLRQGEGIIDLVNGYAATAMFFGIVGLGLLLGPFLLGMWRTYRVCRESATADQDLSLLGAGLIACMLGTLAMMAIGAFRLGLETMFYVQLGLAVGYGQLEAARSAAPARDPHDLEFEARPR